MWLKINYLNNNLEYVIFKEKTILVSLETSLIAPIDENDTSIRFSNIFPLVKTASIPNLLKCSIYFFDFDNPFRTLGIINQKGSKEIKEKIFFSNGLCSILLFSDKNSIYNELQSLIKIQPTSYEIWNIENNLIVSVKTSPPSDIIIKLPKVVDYSSLPLVERAVLDEFAISIHILKSKIAQHDIYNSNNLINLVKLVNIFIKELVYLTKLKGPKPKSLYITNSDRLKDPLENQILRQQNIDRLIQINSALSYVSTQSYSGAIPILERRSLIRRNSLLGIGLSLRALNRIVEYIELSFESIDFIEIITVEMLRASPLNGLIDELNKLTYKKNDWYTKNIDVFTSKSKTANPEISIRKLAYFSSRLGFRESEFSITAALNSLPAGLSLSWSLLTITHEMLHSHVRQIFVSIFYGDESISEIDNHFQFYELYSKKLKGDQVENYSLLDSIRGAIFNYCLKTQSYGSLTVQKLYQTPVSFRLPDFKTFYEIFQSEIRNLNEIFVHILDFHYFYKGKITNYVPLIWCSWSAIPHINADIRQYILRTLITIASKIDADPYQRWEISKSYFLDALNSCKSHAKTPLIGKVIEILNNERETKDYYFQAFRNSLIIADVVTEIFLSKKISANIWDDENITTVSEEEGTEGEFSYSLPDDFINSMVKCPIPYIYDKLIKILREDIVLNNDIEEMTMKTYIGVNSKI
jgi:hypothetical protein